MQKPALVVMAAGMGSRYGGLKQIDPIGPSGEKIIDYSIYDALKAGFGKVVFIIKEDIEQVFRENIGRRVEKLVDTEYVFQKIDDVPAGIQVPAERVKPWGTAHAVLSCRHVVHTPFAVINADDFYGSTSFRILHDYLASAEDRDALCRYGMVGFTLENTLTEHGHVARGICTVDAEGCLEEIHERTRIQKFGTVTKYTEDDENWIVIPAGSIVSMNIWGFTPDFFKEIEDGFPKFFQAHKANMLKAEYFLPAVVDRLISEGRAKVKVLQSKERWYGVTYREDKPRVEQAITRLSEQGVYPENLWEDFR